MFEAVFQREVLLVPVPFTDLSSSKKRPVLVLSNDAYNSTSDDFLAAGITSKVAKRSHAVIIEPNDLEGGSLPLTSQIRADKIYALNKNIVLKKFGKVNASVFREVVNEVTSLIS